MGTTETALCGPTCSPWSQEHIAGGSSGGAGAVGRRRHRADRAGVDGGGSIRIPAACCGVVGLKPSRGRISFGPDAGEPLSGWAVRFAVSRSVRDSAALLDALHGPEPGDPTLLPPPEHSYLDECFRDAGPPPDRVLHAAVERRAGASRARGGRPSRRRWCWPTSATPSTAPHRGVDWEPFLRLHGRHVERQHRPRHRRVRGRPRPRAVARQPRAGHLRDVALRLGADRLAGAGGARPHERREPAARLLLRRVGRAPDADARAPAGAARRVSVVGRGVAARGVRQLGPRRELPAGVQLQRPARDLAAAAPGATSGLPIGMQLVGRLGDEATLFRVAAQLEEALPWRDRLPALHVSR